MSPIYITLSFWASINATVPVPVVIPWEGTLQQCETWAQAEIAAWVEDHPSTTVIGPYRCKAEPVPGSGA